MRKREKLQIVVRKFRAKDEKKEDEALNDRAAKRRFVVSPKDRVHAGTPQPLVCSLNISCGLKKLSVKTANRETPEKTKLTMSLEVKFEKPTIFESLLDVVPKFKDARWNWFDLNFTIDGGEVRGQAHINLGSSIESYRKYERGYVWNLEAKRDSKLRSPSAFPSNL